MTLTVTGPPASRQSEWLRIDHSSHTVVAVVAAGGVADGRAEELWSLVEHALEIADGRTVMVDLTGVAGFDHHTVEALRTIVKTALRRRDDVQILLHPDGGLDHYARQYGLDPRIIHPANAPSPRASEPAGRCEDYLIAALD